MFLGLCLSVRLSTVKLRVGQVRIRLAHDGFRIIINKKNLQKLSVLISCKILIRSSASYECSEMMMQKDTTFSSVILHSTFSRVMLGPLHQ